MKVVDWVLEAPIVTVVQLNPYQGQVTEVNMVPLVEVLFVEVVLTPFANGPN